MCLYGNSSKKVVPIGRYFRGGIILVWVVTIIFIEKIYTIEIVDLKCSLSLRAYEVLMFLWLHPLFHSLVL